VINEQIVVGTGRVKGRRISIMPSEFGVQIAVEQYVVPAFAAGVALKLRVPSREIMTANSKSFLFTDFTFLVGDASEPLESSCFNRVNLIETLVKMGI
jgi:hypothetical protein